MPKLYDPAIDDVTVRQGDISEDVLASAFDRLVLAVDIETSGLDWSSDDIASVQVAVPKGPIELVRITPDVTIPERLVELLTSPSVLKVFHHAMFDLRFMRRVWGVQADRVACTKVAAKVRDPAGEHGHRLIDLLSSYLGVEIDKSEQTSDWQSETLTDRQIAYAANDVRYLGPLFHALLGDLRRRGLERLALACFHHIPTRVELEVLGLGDVYTY